MKVKSESEVAQLCLTLSDPMDCSLPGSSVHGIFQARVLEWVAIAFSLETLTREKYSFCFKEYICKIIHSAGSKTMVLLLKKGLQVENINRVIHLGKLIP